MRINRSTPRQGSRPGPSDPPSEAEIRRLVTRFYGRVRDDALLGAVFEARIQEWEPHLDRMSDFWSGILRASGRYRGNPVGAHAAIEGLEPAHFRRWLHLFEEVARETLPAGAARDVVARAGRMSQVLQRTHPDIPDQPDAAPSSNSSPSP